MFGVGLLTLGCGSAGGGDCPVGEPGCPCAAGTCPAGLECREDICVFADGATSGDSGTSDVSSSAASSTADSDSGDGAAPEVVDLFTDIDRLGESDVIAFTASVTDADGLDDIVGGVLVDGESQAVYGPFVQISAGTFSISVSWEEVDTASTIEFEREGTRTFRVEFEDKTQRLGERSIEIPFDCGGPDFAVCGDGVCRELGTPTDCGGCNDTCTACDAGSCLQSGWSACFSAQDHQNCDQACAALGYASCYVGCESAEVDNPIAATMHQTFADCENDVSVVASLGYCTGTDLPIFAVARCCCG